MPAAAVPGAKSSETLRRIVKNTTRRRRAGDFKVCIMYVSVCFTLCVSLLGLLNSSIGRWTLGFGLRQYLDRWTDGLGLWALDFVVRCMDGWTWALGGIRRSLDGWMDLGFELWALDFVVSGWMDGWTWALGFGLRRSLDGWMDICVMSWILVTIIYILYK